MALKTFTLHAENTHCAAALYVPLPHSAYQTANQPGQTRPLPRRCRPLAAGEDRRFLEISGHRRAPRRYSPELSIVRHCSPSFDCRENERRLIRVGRIQEARMLNGSPLLLWLFLLQFGIQVNRAAGDVEGFGPVGEAFLFDGYLMATGADIDSRRRVSNKRAIYLDVCAGGGRFDTQQSLSSCKS